MKYVVCGNTSYYPWVNEYNTYEEAKECYDKHNPFEETVYLCKVLRTKSNEITTTIYEDN